ncbi:iron dicitrate transporter FecR [Azorhizobium oxalatiphilum]|uniref:Iron dicitrate transporter FecR n=1 Tax=Azorhizobium oxalatiphilum TaxID=980631 RepID=A0A917CAP6_9HYPH|nr:FecR domain-containing protein [Azorhizobium oxalatiphilum]GGF78371.1 iron dicitrate transporter FecR [Azorhizobium oxalatiphilum]
MTEMPEARRLFREAADLAIRLQNDPANPVSQEMVRLWVARGPAHATAWAQVAEIHGMTGSILAAQRKAESGRGLSRRTLLAGGVLALGAAGAGSLVLPQAMLQARADYVTHTAEIRRIDLPDGSIMTLGPDSAVGLAYTPQNRGVTLLAGMAYFEVAGAAAPFRVVFEDVAATASDSLFDVSSDGGFLSVSVGQGEVEVHEPHSVLKSGARLVAGDWLTLGMSSHEVTRGTRETFQVGAWREGVIVAERETVSAMVAKIARWQPGRVVVADPFLGARVVSGVFDLKEPLSALEAVVRPFGAHVRRVGGYVTVISPV